MKTDDACCRRAIAVSAPLLWQQAGPFHALDPPL
jgi:hypothetical protein